MSQSAKAQEPSMEEILASIRRIIADDDATKPPKPAEPAPKPAAARPTPVPPAPRPAPAPPPPRPAAPPPPPPPKAAPPPPPPAPAPAPGAAMNQDDIDAMLAGLDAEVREEEPPPPPEPEPAEADILDLTEAMEAPAEEEEAPSFRTIDGQSDVVFAEPEPEPEPAFEEPPPPQVSHAGPERSLLSAATSAAVDSAFNSLAQTVLVQNARTLEDLVREMLRPMLKSWLDDNLPGMVERMVRAEIERVSRGRP